MTSEPMTPECEPSSEPLTYLQLADEVVRLRAWLQHIHDEKNHSGYTLRHYAWRALEGQKIEDWQ